MGRSGSLDLGLELVDALIEEQHAGFDLRDRGNSQFVHILQQLFEPIELFVVLVQVIGFRLFRD